MKLSAPSPPSVRPRSAARAVLGASALIPLGSGRLTYGVAAVRGVQRALDFREARRREARRRRTRRLLLVGALLGTAAVGVSRIAGGVRS